jgi:succinate dehydrogenase / fumarate reductase cytochrome b subunit
VPGRAVESSQRQSPSRGTRLRHNSASKYNRSDVGAPLMSTFRRVFSSSVGTKLLIGLTGLALFAYLILHLIGNALIFAGPDTFNGYSHTLISNPLILPVEIGLLAIFLLHVYKAITNYLANQAARPVGYATKKYAGHTSRKSVASSTMIWSGLTILIFVVVHVKQFKYGRWYGTAAESSIRDLARTEFEVFGRPLWVAFYVVATLIVGLHLRHGISSSFQSIGFDHPIYTRRLTMWGIALAAIIGGGLAFIPVWVYFTR